MLNETKELLRKSQEETRESQTLLSEALAKAEKGDAEVSNKVKGL